MGRIAWGILALVTALASAQGADVPFNIDFTVGWGGFYRPQEWTPIDIDIRLVVPEKDKDKIKIVQRFGSEYFDLAKSNTPAENQLLSTQQPDEELLVVLRGQAYLIK